MHDQVEIGTRMHPEAEAVEIGDRRDYRYVKPLAAAQTAKHASDCWIGGNHDVGVVLLDHSKQGARAEGEERQPADTAEKRGAPEQLVEEPVGASHMPELPAVAVAEDEAQDVPEAVESIEKNDLELGVLTLQLGDERLGGRNVTFADRRGENEYAPPLGLGLLAKFPSSVESANEEPGEPEAGQLDGEKQ
jgi:hypothetical protein